MKKQSASSQLFSSLWGTLAIVLIATLPVKAQDVAGLDTGLSGQESQLQSVENLFAPMTDLSIDIRPKQGEIPRDRSPDLFSRPTRNWFEFSPPELVFMWEAPNICYQPLYFEDVPLERFGQTCDPRKAVARSTAHFGISLFALPLNMIRDPIRSCNTPYGYCRPGDLVPAYKQQVLFAR